MSEIFIIFWRHQRNRFDLFYCSWKWILVSIKKVLKTSKKVAKQTNEMSLSYHVAMRKGKLVADVIFTETGNPFSKVSFYSHGTMAGRNMHKLKSNFHALKNNIYSFQLVCCRHAKSLGRREAVGRLSRFQGLWSIARVSRWHSEILVPDILSFLWWIVIKIIYNIAGKWIVSNIILKNKKKKSKVGCSIRKNQNLLSATDVVFGFYDMLLNILS